MKFRKKPVIIEAWQYLGQKTNEWPEWLTQSASSEIDDGILIKTLEGDMRASRGDWIIQGVKGELYPCKPDIFASTYERVK